MTTEYDPSTTEEQMLSPTWLGFPTTSTEFITLLAHYYRAEIARMAGWPIASIVRPTGRLR